MADAARRAAELRGLIDRADDLYFNHDAPEISDAQYDRLVDELLKIELRHPELITADSPTQKIAGQPKASFPSVTHDVPMMSLDKIHEDPPEAKEDKAGAKLELFFARCAKETGGRECLAMPKLDGMAVSLVYIDGRLSCGATRGDGLKGENITPNVRHVRNVPQQLKNAPPGRLLIRGEAMIARGRLAEINRQQQEAGKPEFVNPRNAAAGTLRQLEAELVARRQVDFVAYSVIGEGAPPTAAAGLQLLAKMGLQAAEPVELVADVASFRRYAELIARRKEDYPYDIDGIVLRLNDSAAGVAMGTTAKAPRSMAAYKFLAEKARTRLLGVDWQVGRTGVVAPVAQLEPVKIGDVTVAAATLHNPDFIKDRKGLLIDPNAAEGEIPDKDKGLRIGDLVEVVRSGDVIPKIEKIVVERRTGDEREVPLPDSCPACGSELRVDGVNLVCGGTDCAGVKIALLRYAVSRPVLDMEGLAEKTLEKMVRHGFVSEPADLFALSEKDFIKLVQLEKEEEAAEQPAPAPAAEEVDFGVDAAAAPRARIDAIAAAARRLITAAGEGRDLRQGQARAEAVAQAAAAAIETARAAGEPKQAASLEKLAAKQTSSVAAAAAKKRASLAKQAGQRQTADAETARRLHGIIAKAKDTTFAKVLMALNIHGLGKTASEELAATAAPEEFIRRGDAAALCFVTAVNYKTAARLKEFFASGGGDLLEAERGYVSRDHVAKMKRAGVQWPAPQPQPRRLPFAALLKHVNYLNDAAPEEGWPRLSGRLVDELKKYDVKSVDEILEQGLAERIMVRHAAVAAEEALRTLARLPAFRRLQAQLAKYVGVEWSAAAQPAAAGKLAGKIVLVTGKLAGYTREGAQELVKKHGGTVASAVSAKTSLVVLGDKPGGSKVKKAEELRIETMAGDDFLSLLGEDGGAATA